MARSIGRRAFSLALSFAAIATAQVATAQPASWPGKPVRLVSVFPPGGSVDQVARILAAQLTTQTGQSFFVENKGGASGSIGTQMVAKAEPDGYTFAVVFDTHATNPTLISGIGFNTLQDLAPVTLIGTSPMVVVSHPGQPYRNFADLLAAAKAKPGSVAFGSIGSGSLGHLAMTQLGNQLGIEFNHVPYRGGGPLTTDVLGGQVGVAIGTVFLFNPQVKAGKLNALGVTSSKPASQMPAVVPIAAQGVPGFDALSWWGVFAPAATPAPILKRLHEELMKALKTPAVAEKLAGQGMDVVASTPEELDRFLRPEIERWAKVIKNNQIRAGD